MPRLAVSISVWVYATQSTPFKIRRVMCAVVPLLF